MGLLDHPESRSMLSYLDQHPGEEHPALVFADWAEEHGFPAHAEVIRLHHSQEPDSDNQLDQRDRGGNRFINSGLLAGVHQSRLHLSASPSKTKTLRVWLPLQPGQPFKYTPTVKFQGRLPHKQANALYKAVKQEGAL